jgi:anti-sigma factor RsiW
MPRLITCTTINRGGLDYALGWLTPARRAAFDAHLAGCPLAAHRAFAADLALSTQLRSLATPGPSPAVRNRILAQIRAEITRDQGQAQPSAY